MHSVNKIWRVRLKLALFSENSNAMDPSRIGTFLGNPFRFSLVRSILSCMVASKSTCVGSLLMGKWQVVRLSTPVPAETLRNSRVNCVFLSCDAVSWPFDFFWCFGSWFWVFCDGWAEIKEKVGDDKEFRRMCDVFCVCCSGQKVLHCAAEMGQLKICEFLIENVGVQIDVLTYRGSLSPSLSSTFAVLVGRDATVILEFLFQGLFITVINN